MFALGTMVSIGPARDQSESRSSKLFVSADHRHHQPQQQKQTNQATRRTQIKSKSPSTTHKQSQLCLGQKTAKKNCQSSTQFECDNEPARSKLKTCSDPQQHCCQMRSQSNQTNENKPEENKSTNGEPTDIKASSIIATSGSAASSADKDLTDVTMLQDNRKNFQQNNSSHVEQQSSSTSPQFQNDRQNNDPANEYEDDNAGLGEDVHFSGENQGSIVMQRQPVPSHNHHLDGVENQLVAQDKSASNTSIVSANGVFKSKTTVTSKQASNEVLLRNKPNQHQTQSKYKHYSSSESSAIMNDLIETNKAIDPHRAFKIQAEENSRNIKISISDLERKKQKATRISMTQQPHQTNKSLPTAAKATSKSIIAYESRNICAGCARPILDQYLLEALNKRWHEDCLKCACCECRLGEVGSSLFVHLDKVFCRRDYLRIFGQRGQCAVCRKPIEPYELVMRAKGYAYHIECFSCQQCQSRFCVGDQFCLWEPSKIVCYHCHQNAATSLLVASRQPATPGTPTSAARSQGINQARQDNSNSNHNQAPEDHLEHLSEITTATTIISSSPLEPSAQLHQDIVVQAPPLDKL